MLKRDGSPVLCPGLLVTVVDGPFTGYRGQLVRRVPRTVELWCLAAEDMSQDLYVLACELEPGHFEVPGARCG